MLIISEIKLIYYSLPFGVLHEFMLKVYIEKTDAMHFDEINCAH
jgi:hypothetical protein